MGMLKTDRAQLEHALAHSVAVATLATKYESFRQNCQPQRPNARRETFFEIKVDRAPLVRTAFERICRAHPNEVKLPLRVKFQSEDGGAVLCAESGHGRGKPAVVSVSFSFKQLLRINGLESRSVRTKYRHNNFKAPGEMHRRKSRLSRTITRKKNTLHVVCCNIPMKDHP
jgi:hypothetical protein